MKQQSRVLLIGSTGFLGKVLMLPLQQIAHVVPTHRSKIYFTNSYHYDFWTDNIHALVKQQRINTIIIAASMAYEATNPTYKFTNFMLAVKQLIQGCRQCRVVYVSSDGIFDGKRGNYTESDVPTPITSYGKNLQYFEEKIQELCSDYCIIRPSYLYGYALSQLDHRLSHVRSRLLAGEHLTYFIDMIKSPMEVNQVAKAITILASSNYIGIVHVAGKAMSIYDFYQEAMNSLGISSERLHTAQMPTDFLYPRDTSLSNDLLKKLTKIEPLPVQIALAQSQH